VYAAPDVRDILRHDWILLRRSRQTVHVTRYQLVTVVLVIVVSTLLPLLLISSDAPSDSDEAHHVLLALSYERHVGQGDVVGFIRRTLKTGRYPFLHGWYVAGTFGVFGADLFVARASSGVLLGLSAGLAAFLLFRLRPSTHPAWGLLAGAFVTLAPEHLTNGVLCMLEIPGLFLSLLAAFLYLRRLDRPESRWRALAAGACLVALLFVKYPYGAYLLAPLGLAEAVRARFRPLELLRPPSVFVWGPVLAVLALWLAVPQTRQGVLMLLADDPGEIHIAKERDPFRIPYVQPDLVLYYVRTLARSLPPGWILGICGLAGTLAFAVCGRLFERTVVLGAVLWTMFTLTLSYRTFGVDRFLVPVGGLFAVAAVGGIRDILRATAGRSGAAAVAVRVALVGVLLAGSGEALYRARHLPRLAEEAVETGEREASALAWIRSSIDPPANVLLVGCWDQLSPDTLEVDLLLSRPDLTPEDLDVKGLGISKIFRSTEKIERWFETDSWWDPAPDRPRKRFVMVIEPKEDTVGPPADVEDWGRIRAHARERLRGLEPVASREDDLARFDLYLLPER
jgi:hypothetical protein